MGTSTGDAQKRKSHSARESRPSVHKPVLLRDVIHWLDVQPGETVVDGTVGAGGHSREILKHIGPQGKLIGLDRDPTMLRLARTNISDSRCVLRQANYAELPTVLSDVGVPSVDRVLLDLGLSSDQLADDSRGFRFDATGALDLRFDPTHGEPAWKLIERCSQQELADVFRQYGEERFSERIARRLADLRRARPVRTGRDLAEAVLEAIPRTLRQRSRIHPATRVFQALRIAVNEELTHLQVALNKTIPGCLRTGGRLVVITFHSLEDRLVKDAFRDDQQWQNLTPKPITPSAAEKKTNPRCRSAKLRAALKR